MSGHGWLGKTDVLLDDMIDVRIRNDREDQWGEMPGVIIDFDPAKQTATVRPLYRPRRRNGSVAIPDLLDVPVRFPRAGGGAVTFPVRPGDKVTLRPEMRNTEAYHEADGAFEARDARTFNLSDMEAFLDGGESLSDPIRNFDAENHHTRFDEEGRYGIRGSADGRIAIEGAEGNVYEIIATMFELIAADRLQIAFGSSAGTGHALENRDQLIEMAAKLRAMAL